MNAAVRLPMLPDVQPRADHRALAIDAVGIRRLRSPVRIRAGWREIPASGTIEMQFPLFLISSYGAHNQRSLLGIDAELSGAMEMDEP